MVRVPVFLSSKLSQTGSCSNILLIPINFDRIPKSNKIIIGHDGRNSSLKIKNSLIKTFLKFGIDVVDISLIPTPISYFANNIK